jgi:hypothetical protein
MRAAKNTGPRSTSGSRLGRFGARPAHRELRSSDITCSDRPASEVIAHADRARYHRYTAAALRNWPAARASARCSARSTSEATSRPAATTPAPCSAPTARRWPPTARSTSSTSTSLRRFAAASRSASRRGSGQSPSRPRWTGWACRSATTCGPPTSTAGRSAMVNEVAYVPAAFTLATGRDRREPLLWARGRSTPSAMCWRRRRTGGTAIRGCARVTATP